MAETGWIKDKWKETDYLYERKAGVVVLPGRYFLSELLPEVLDQERMNSCVAQGVISLAWGLCFSLGLVFKKFGAQYSWNGARAIEGTLPYNVGVYPRDAFDWTIKQGLLYEIDWPYSGQTLDKTAPSSDRMSKALRYKELAYFRVGDGVDGLRSALSEGHLIAIGAPWADKWKNPNSNGLLQDVTIDDFGDNGHEFVIYGYDDKVELFYCQNSWGKRYGVDGRFSFSYKLVDLWKKAGGYDAHYLDCKEEPGPPMPPVPIEKPGCLLGSKILKLFKR